MRLLHIAGRNADGRRAEGNRLIAQDANLLPSGHRIEQRVVNPAKNLFTIHNHILLQVNKGDGRLGPPLARVLWDYFSRVVTRSHMLWVAISGV